MKSRLNTTLRFLQGEKSLPRQYPFDDLDFVYAGEVKVPASTKCVSHYINDIGNYAGNSFQMYLRSDLPGVSWCASYDEFTPPVTSGFYLTGDETIKSFDVVAGEYWLGTDNNYWANDNAPSGNARIVFSLVDDPAQIYASGGYLWDLTTTATYLTTRGAYYRTGLSGEYFDFGRSPTDGYGFTFWLYLSDASVVSANGVQVAHYSYPWGTATYSEGDCTTTRSAAAPYWRWRETAEGGITLQDGWQLIQIPKHKSAAVSSGSIGAPRWDRITSTMVSIVTTGACTVYMTPMWFGPIGGWRKVLNPDEITTQRNLHRGRSDDLLLLFDGVPEGDATVQVLVWANK